jgi:hypothetical protein
MDDSPKINKPDSSGSKGMISSVLSRTLATLRDNPQVYFVLAAVAVAPPCILQFLLAGSTDAAPKIFTGILSQILNSLIQGAAAYAVYKSLTGECASVKASIAYALKLIVPLALTSLLVSIGIGIGIALFVIPGLILMCLWAVTIPACAVEKLSATGSIKRSMELTKGYRWGIFALMVIVGLASILSNLIIVFVFAKIDPHLTYLLFSAVNWLITAFSCVMVPTIYYGLRLHKEGVSLDSLVDVFD